MKFLVDMNLSPEWLGILSLRGWTASHWQNLGPATAADMDLLQWAREHETIILTQDLDFAQLLHQTHTDGPSVILLRVRDEFDAVQQNRICQAITLAASALQAGAILVIDDRRVRLRRLPIKSNQA